MTDPQLHDAILADPTAKALALAGNDSGVAARMAAILPPAIVPTFATERKVYDALAPADALAVMQGLKAVAAGNPSATPPVAPNPVVAKTLEWMAPSEGGVDVGNASVRGMLDQLAAAGALAPASVATLKALAQQPAAVDPGQVSRCLIPYRNGGL